jgi:hypothetical protein
VFEPIGALPAMDAAEAPESLDSFEPPAAEDGPAWFVDAAPAEPSAATAQPAPAVDFSWDGEQSAPDGLLRDDLTMDAGQPEVEAGAVQGELPPEPELAELAFAATFEELSDVQPFTIEEPEPAVSVESDVVDFSDINEEPFDPGALSQIIAPENQSAALPDWAADADEIAASLVAESTAESPWQESAPVEEPVEGPQLVQVAANVDAEEHTGENGSAPRSVIAWPAFVNHTSELIDRGHGSGNLFGRLRESKRAAVAAGLLAVDRSVANGRQGPPAVVEEESVQVISMPVTAANDPAAITGGLSEEERIDLMTMRVRLIEDAESAEEVARALEAALARGMNDPLALRVLGEAYLKLGRTEQAAAQFRQAMLARRRVR